MKKNSSKPFVSNVVSKLVRLYDAKNAMDKAVSNLKKAAEYSGSWAEYETIIYFANEIEKVMSTDHDESGFNPWFREIVKKGISE